jgi:hypothetical protein
MFFYNKTLIKNLLDSNKFIAIIFIAIICTIITNYFIDKKITTASKQRFEIMQDNLSKSQTANNGKLVIKSLLTLQRLYRDDLIIDNIIYTEDKQTLSFEIMSETKSALYNYINNLVQNNNHWHIEKIDFEPDINIEKYTIKKKIKQEAYQPFVFRYLGLIQGNNKIVKEKYSDTKINYENYANVVFKITE